MNILVCVKQVADDSVSIGLNPNSGLPAIEDVTPTVNAFDSYALEMAVRLKEVRGGTVTVVSVGTEDVCNSLKNCLAVGADQALLINDTNFLSLDGAGVSRVLATAIKKMEQTQGKAFDAIFFGKESTDYTSGQIGTVTAELLQRGIAPCAIALAAESDPWEIHSETEDGYCVLSANAPIVLTVSKPAYEPRYATIKSKLAARKVPITIWSAADLPGLDMAQIGISTLGEKTVGMHEVAKRTQGHIISKKTTGENVQELIRELRNAGVL